MSRFEWFMDDVKSFLAGLTRTQLDAALAVVLFIGLYLVLH